jgi:hypothetical protein
MDSSALEIKGGIVLTNIGLIEYSVLIASLNGLCDKQAARCGCGECPCDSNGGCLMGKVKDLLREHLIDRAGVREVGV